MTFASCGTGFLLSLYIHVLWMCQIFTERWAFRIRGRCPSISASLFQASAVSALRWPPIIEPASLPAPWSCMARAEGSSCWSTSSPCFVGRWVDGSGCLWQMFRSRPDRIVLDTNQIRIAACTTLRCKKATCQHKFAKRCRQCASTVHKPKWMKIYRCGESNSRSLCCRSHRGWNEGRPPGNEGRHWSVPRQRWDL